MLSLLFFLCLGATSYGSRLTSKSLVLGTGVILDEVDGQTLAITGNVSLGGHLKFTGGDYQNKENYVLAFTSDGSLQPLNFGDLLSSYHANHAVLASDTCDMSVSASSQYGTFSGSRATDCDASTYWSSSVNTYDRSTGYPTSALQARSNIAADSQGTKYGEWIKVDQGSSPKKFNTVSINIPASYVGWGAYFKDFTVYGSDSGSGGWNVLLTKGGQTTWTGDVDTEFSLVDTFAYRYVLLQVHRLGTYGSDHPNHHTAIRELKYFYKA